MDPGEAAPPKAPVSAATSPHSRAKAIASMFAVNTRPKLVKRRAVLKTDGLCHEANLGVKHGSAIVQNPKACSTAVRA